MRLEWANLLCTERERPATSYSTTSADKRSRFKKDYDTICNSTGLRRMQDKAQVFPLEKSDYSRTRLTHSIEVMSIAESLGTDAVEFLLHHEIGLSDDTIALINDIPMLLKAAALLHDMGNPPFGHLGEEIIGKWFRNHLNSMSIKKNGRIAFVAVSTDPSDVIGTILRGQRASDLMNFEGNAQLLRLISKLSYVNDRFGMNLSYALMAVIIKYPIDSTEISKTNVIAKKPGYFYSERELVKRIHKKTGIYKQRHPLTYLLEAADDIAYLTADLEDAHKKKLVSLDTILKELNSKRSDPFIAGILDEIVKFEKDANDIKYPNVETYVIQRMRIFIKGKMIEAASDAFRNNYVKIMNGEFESELLDVSAAGEMKSIFSQIERKYIYFTGEITKSKIEAYTIINGILESLVMCTLNERDDDKDDVNTLLFNRMSENYKFACAEANKDLDETMDQADIIYNKLLLVTDYVSGMTDTFAKDFYNMLVANV